MIEVEEHDDAGLGVEAGQRDDPHPDRGAEIVAEQIQQPERADERERHRQQHNGGFHH